MTAAAIDHLRHELAAVLDRGADVCAGIDQADLARLLETALVDGAEILARLDDVARFAEVAA